MWFDLSAGRGYKDTIQVPETVSRRMTDAQIAERWRATGSQIRSRLLLSCNSSESLGNIAFLHFVIPDTTQRTGESFLDIKVDGRNPASRIGIGQRRRKLALVTRTVGLAASSVGFVFNLAICIRAITSSARFMSILVTGGAGYIGNHMVRLITCRLASTGPFPRACRSSSATPAIRT
jgi:hypothetical protein